MIMVVIEKILFTFLVMYGLLSYCISNTFRISIVGNLDT